MKRMLALLMLPLLLFCAACGGDPPPVPEESAGTAPSAPTETATTESAKEETTVTKETKGPGRLLYMGQGSVRITTPEGKVIFVDPYVGEGYGPAADLILITHGHHDHNNPDRIENRNPDCRLITWVEALEGGVHQTFALGWVTVEAVEAGYNRNHDVKNCVGYLLTLSDGISVYLTGDTSTTRQMPELARRQIDYAFFCCDGVYNMGLKEAAECARLVGAKHNVPYHIISKTGGYFDRVQAERFNAPNRLIVDENEEIELK